MQKEFYVYVLKDAKGDYRAVVVDDPSDNLCIGGYDSNGEYQQYDSYEDSYAGGWAEKHGFTLRSQKQEIEVYLGPLFSDKHSEGESEDEIERARR